jgi:hypothetical protein
VLIANILLLQRDSKTFVHLPNFLSPLTFYQPSHKFAIAAPAPNRAAAPIAPVFIGTPAPLLVLLAAADAPPPIVVDGAGAAEVKGMFEALLAPLKAGAPDEAEADGAAKVLFGLRTLQHKSAP